MTFTLSKRVVLKVDAISFQDKLIFRGLVAIVDRRDRATAATRNRLVERTIKTVEASFAVPVSQASSLALSKRLRERRRAHNHQTRGSIHGIVAVVCSKRAVAVATWYIFIAISYKALQSRCAVRVGRAGTFTPTDIACFVDENERACRWVVAIVQPSHANSGATWNHSIVVLLSA